MKGGISTAAGIVLYDTEKEGSNAVFCFFEEGKPTVKTGNRKELLEEMKTADKIFKKDAKKSEDRILLITFLAFLGLIGAVWLVFGGFFAVFGMILFAAASFFPVLILAFSANRLYPDDEAFHRFRRFHGAEHTVIAYSSKKNPTWELDDIRKTSFYHGECGTVYAASVIVLAAIIGISFAFIPKIGFLWFMGITLISVMGLFANLFNPYNPLKFFHAFVVEKPGDAELLLAAKGIKILDGI